MNWSEGNTFTAFVNLKVDTIKLAFVLPSPGFQGFFMA